MLVFLLVLGLLGTIAGGELARHAPLDSGRHMLGVSLMALSFGLAMGSLGAIWASGGAP